MMKRNIWQSVALTLLAFSLAGCGGAGPIKPTDEQNVFASIESLGDLAGDAEAFPTAFVSGAVPENRQEYAQRGYQVNGEPVYNGDSVTVPVKIFGGVYATGSGDARNSKASSDDETSQTWTLQKVDDQWKIKDAPIS